MRPSLSRRSCVLEPRTVALIPTRSHQGTIHETFVYKTRSLIDLALWGPRSMLLAATGTPELFQRQVTLLISHKHESRRLCHCTQDVLCQAVIKRRQHNEPTVTRSSSRNSSVFSLSKLLAVLGQREFGKIWSFWLLVTHLFQVSATITSGLSGIRHLSPVRPSVTEILVASTMNDHSGFLSNTGQEGGKRGSGTGNDGRKAIWLAQIYCHTEDFCQRRCLSSKSVVKALWPFFSVQSDPPPVLKPAPLAHKKGETNKIEARSAVTTARTQYGNQQKAPMHAWIIRTLMESVPKPHPPQTHITQ